MKFEKSPIWRTFEGGLSKKVKVAPSRTQQKIHFNISKHSGYCRKSRTSGTKKRSKAQDKQRLRFQYCDCLYRGLREEGKIIYDWFYNEHGEGEIRKGLRSIFMSECLKFELADLLAEYLQLYFDYFKIEETEDEYIIKARLASRLITLTDEELSQPREYRAVR